MSKLKNKKKILVLTTNRSDYGLLKNLIFEIKKNNSISLKVVAAGSHFLKKYGNSFAEIKNDRVKIFKKINAIYKSDSSFGVTDFNLEMSKKFNEILNKHRFDMLLILGDRSEILFFVTIALIHNIKIAHLHGGEITEGAIDNKVRNAISKLSNLHFVSHKEYKKNLINMGIKKKYIFNYGGLGASSINQLKIISKNEIQKSIKIELNKKYLLVTYHPVTDKRYQKSKEFLNLMSSLNQCKDIIKIITAPNIDVKNSQIIKIINSFVKNKEDFYYIKSLGTSKYYSLMYYSEGVVGNSSSGILEASSFKIPSLNIGNRQLGRIQPFSVINVNSTRNQIYKGLKKILYNKNFKNSLKKVKNIYYQPNTEKKIVNTILNF